MKNNKGFAKYEVVTVLVLILAVGSYLMYVFLGGTPKTKMKVFKSDALRLSDTVATNIASFHNTGIVFLQEVYDEKLISTIKNPLGFGNCDETESKVEIIDGKPVVWLKCGNYLFHSTNISNDSDNKMYSLSDWSTEKKSGYKAKEMYNCTKDGKELFPKYYDEAYFVSRINNKFETDYYFADNIIDECKVVKKTFYRKETLIK